MHSVLALIQLKMVLVDAICSLQMLTIQYEMSFKKFIAEFNSNLTVSAQIEDSQIKAKQK